jgi:hypothetical protein
LRPEDGWLVGWKAIGKYCGVTVNTVRRWHKKYGMPVMSSPTGTRIGIRTILDYRIIHRNIEKLEKELLDEEFLP